MTMQPNVHFKCPDCGRRHEILHADLAGANAQIEITCGCGKQWEVGFRCPGGKVIEETIVWDDNGSWAWVDRFGNVGNWEHP
jgi:hypothetical protein